jgi:hypothetical protein
VKREVPERLAEVVEVPERVPARSASARSAPSASAPPAPDDPVWLLPPRAPSRAAGSPAVPSTDPPSVSSAKASRSASTRLNTMTSPSRLEASSAACVSSAVSNASRRSRGKPRLSSASSFTPGGRRGYPGACRTTRTATGSSPPVQSPEAASDTRMRYCLRSRSSKEKSSSYIACSAVSSSSHCDQPVASGAAPPPAFFFFAIPAHLSTGRAASRTFVVCFLPGALFRLPRLPGTKSSHLQRESAHLEHRGN